MYPDDTLLRTALGANAVFSGLSALAIALGAPAIGPALGTISPGALYVLAGILALFAADLGLQLRSDRLNPLRAFGATVGDLLWVAGSAVLLVLRPEAVSRAGLVVVAAVAIPVLLLALLQLLGLRRYARNQRGETDEPSMYRLTRILEAPASRVWPLLRSLDRIGEFYDALESVEVEEGEERTVRSCTDRKGRRWSEELLELDDRNRSLTLRFAAEADDFPFPMTSMVGGWEVASRGERCELTLWYEFAMGGGIAGEIGAALAAPLFDRRMGPVLESLERAAARSPGAAARSGESAA